MQRFPLKLRMMLKLRISVWLFGRRKNRQVKKSGRAGETKGKQDGEREADEEGRTQGQEKEKEQERRR